MPLPVLNPNIDLAQTLRDTIAAALPGAIVEVGAGSPGHFQIRVTAEAFRGKTLLQQQQLVYAAIAHLMTGDGAPVHAVDRLQTLVP